MDKIECQECRVVICEDDSYEVIDKGESINYEFCSMTCIEKFFFPGSTIDLKEKDQEIASCYENLKRVQDDLRVSCQEIAELKAKIKRLELRIETINDERRE